MPVRIRPMTLWRADVGYQPGVLAQTLEPLGFPNAAAAFTWIEDVLGAS